MLHDWSAGAQRTIVVLKGYVKWLSLTIEELGKGDGEEENSQAAIAEKKVQNNLISWTECFVGKSLFTWTKNEIMFIIINNQARYTDLSYLYVICIFPLCAPTAYRFDHCRYGLIRKK